MVGRATIQTWALALVGKAPMGKTEATGVIAAASVSLLTLHTFVLDPKDQAGFWLAVLVLAYVFSAAFLVRGMVGLVGAFLPGPYRVVRRWAGRTLRRLFGHFRPSRPPLGSVRDDSASFIDYLERPDAAFAMKITAVFAQVNASRKVRARIIAWKTLRNELGVEPSKAQLDTVAQTLYDRNDTALEVTEDEIRAYLDAHGVISPEVQPWNASPRTVGDITREFIVLRNEGRALRGRIEGVIWGERQQNLAFGQDDLDDWLGRCAKAVWDYRPDRQPALEHATQQQIPFGNWVVVTHDTMAIDLWRERTTRIDLILAVLDGIIASQPSTSPAISSQDQTVVASI